MNVVLNFLTSAIAWFLKNVNMLVGIVTAVVKLAGSIINIFQPSKDDLVDKIDEWGDKIQTWLFKISDILKKFKGFGV